MSFPTMSAKRIYYLIQNDIALMSVLKILKENFYVFPKWDGELALYDLSEFWAPQFTSKCLEMLKERYAYAVKICNSQV